MHSGDVGGGGASIDADGGHVERTPARAAQDGDRDVVAEEALLRYADDGRARAGRFVQTEPQAWAPLGEPHVAIDHDLRGPLVEDIENGHQSRQLAAIELPWRVGVRRALEANRTLEGGLRVCPVVHADAGGDSAGYSVVDVEADDHDAGSAGPSSRVRSHRSRASREPADHARGRGSSERGARYNAPAMTRRIVVVGTSTEIGKTHVTCCMLTAARRWRMRTAAYKPIATGVSTLCADAEHHAAAAGSAYVAPTFGYRRPVSPHLAAREEERPIDLTAIRARADELATGLDLQIVEGVGGLFSPLGPRMTNVDLVRALGAVTVVLVAPDRLGVLHDVGAVVHAARAAGLPPLVVALSAPEHEDVTTGTNADELAAIGLAEVPAVFPRAGVEAPASLAAAEAVLRRA